MDGHLTVASGRLHSSHADPCRAQHRVMVHFVHDSHLKEGRMNQPVTIRGVGLVDHLEQLSKACVRRARDELR